MPASEAEGGVGDEDCDALIDEGCTCPTGTTRPCYGGPPATEDVGACHGGTPTCAPSGWGACDGAVLPGAELCTGGVDGGCDGAIDSLARRTPRLDHGVASGKARGASGGRA